MNRRNVVVSSILVCAAAAAVYVERGRLWPHAPGAPVVTIEKIEQPVDDKKLEQVRRVSEALRAAIARPLPAPSGEEAQRPAQPEARTITGDQFLGNLQRKATLTEQETASLARVFKIAADMQPGIDAEPSAEARAAYQQQLIEAIELRLKLILKDDRRIELARSELGGLPRITPGT